MKFKRFCALLVLLFVFLTTACGESPELLTFISADEKVDFDGLLVDLAWCGGAAEHPIYVEDTLQYDAFLKRISDVNNALNCEIKVELDADQTPITVGMQTGSHTVDILLCNGIQDYMETNMIYSLSDFTEYIDLSNEKKYGTPGFLEGMMYEGRIYGVSPIQWPGFESTGGYLTVYNRDLFKEYQITDFREYYENNTWTWDTFRYEYMDKYTMQNPDGSRLYSLHTNASDLYQVVFHSNGLQYVEKRPDGSFNIDPYNDAYTYSMQYWHDLFIENKDKIEYQTNTYEFTPYTSGNCATGFAWNSHLVTGPIAYNDNTFDTGVLPIPCGPNVEYGTWGQCIQRSYGFVLPITSNIPESSVQILDMLCEPFDEFGGDAGFFDYYRTNVFSTDLDAQIYLDVLKFIRYDYTFVGDRYGREISYVFEDYFESTSMTLNDALERAKPIIEKLANEYIIGNYDAVYGDK